MNNLSRRSLLGFGSAGLGVAGLAALSACASQKNPSDSATGGSDSSGADSGDWPRTVTDEQGEVTIDKQPTKIVSTSPSVTGTLLAIDAPVVASAATSPSPLTDDKGFFKQWASVADERGVEVLYSNLEFDLESVISFDPDLVIVASSGKDSVADQVDTIKQQFPVIVVDYGKQSWQDLATQLGKVLGLEDKATAAGTEFDSYIKEAKGKITPPEGGASIVSYNGKDKDQAIAKKDSAHADLLTSLGLEVVEADASLDSGNRQRNDFMFVSYENLSKAITGESVFLISTGQDQVQKFLDDETLANLPAVTNNQVYYLGPTSFRIDFYSGKLVADAVVEQLGAS